MFIYYLDVLNWSLCLRKPVLVLFCKPGYFQCWFLWDINLNFIQALSLPVVNSVKSKSSADMGWCTWLINLQPWTSWYLTVDTWLSRVSYSYLKWQNSVVECIICLCYIMSFKSDDSVSHIMNEQGKKRTYFL